MTLTLDLEIDRIHPLIMVNIFTKRHEEAHNGLKVFIAFIRSKRGAPTDEFTAVPLYPPLNALLKINTEGITDTVFHFDVRGKSSCVQPI